MRVGKPWLGWEGPKGGQACNLEVVRRACEKAYKVILLLSIRLETFEIIRPYGLEAIFS